MLWKLLKRLRDGWEDTATKRTLHQGMNSLEQAVPPIIIGATGGSGTRVITLVLQHASCYIGCNLNPANDSLDVARFLRRWIPKAKLWEDEPTHVEEMERMEREFKAALIRQRVEISAPSDRWAVKNPRTIYILPFLLRQQPDLKFIHLIRDGRDMAFSNNQAQLEDHGEQYLGSSGSEDYALRSIELWQKVNLEALAFAKENMPDQYMWLRFEDMCDNPTPNTQRIFDFVGIEGDAEAAAKTIRKPKSVGRWRAQDPALLSRIQEAGHKALETFGYQVDDLS